MAKTQSVGLELIDFGIVRDTNWYRPCVIMILMSETKEIELSEYFDFVAPDVIRIRGHRLGIEHVLGYYLEGYSPEEIAQEYPGLSLEKVYATITYYLRNREELDAYLQQVHDRDEQAWQRWVGNPSPLVQRLQVIREEQAKYK